MTTFLDAIFNAPQPLQVMMGLMAGILFGYFVFNPFQIR